ncbi:MAG: porin family protein [Pseudomonadota bacterium]
MSAKSILGAIKSSGTLGVDQTQVDYLIGMIAAAEGDYHTARDIFRAILAERPDLTRVRLELARVLYVLEDDDAAAHHFRLARADDAARPAYLTIERFLYSIRKRKDFSVRFSFGLTPDSNVNSATTDDTTQLYGFLPAELSDDAQRTSGIGARSHFSFTWLPAIGEDWRGDLQTSIDFWDYENRTFVDIILQSDVGLRRITSKGYISAAGSYSRRWYGDELLYSAYGGRLFVLHDISPRLQGSAFFSVLRHDYDETDSRDGPVLFFTLNALRALSSTNYVGVGASITREFARASIFRSTDYGIRLSYTRELSGGAILEVSTNAGLKRFDEENPLFAVKREDERIGAGLSFSNRNWSLRGWTPIISYGYTRNFGNVNIYDFSRHRAEFRFTRLF